MTYPTDGDAQAARSIAARQASALPSKQTRIGIIGAGVAGLTAAHTLRKMGYDKLVIFEKQPEVGGKVKSVIYQGRTYELGAVWLTADYKTVLKMAREFDVPKVQARAVSLLKADGTALGSSQLLESLGGVWGGARAAISFMNTMRRFPEHRQQGFVGADAELNESIAQFSERHRFLPFTRIMATMMTGCGYGFYSDIPALYWLKLLPMINNIYLRGLIPFNHTFFKFPNGFQQLWSQVAATLPVKLATEVTRIERPVTGPIAVCAGGQSYEFDRIIMTTPLHRADGIIGLSPAEQDLFGRIRNLRYRITVAQTNGNIHGGIVDHVSRDKINHVNFIGNFYENTDVSVFYQMLDETISEEQAQLVLEQDLARGGIRIQKVLDTRTWTYFPHVTKSDLDAGFYQRLDDLQGQQGTYYAGGLLNFETVEHTASHAEYLVRRFFGTDTGDQA